MMLVEPTKFSWPVTHYVRHVRKLVHLSLPPSHLTVHNVMLRTCYLVPLTAHGGDQRWC